MATSNPLNRLYEAAQAMVGLLEHPNDNTTSAAGEGITTATESNNEHNRFEEYRLKSFANWESTYPQPADLAAAGFYYTGQIDRVRCFECSLEICRWEEGDDPQEMHEKWGGRCRFKRKVPCGNVPIGIDPETIPWPDPQDRDIGPCQSKDRPNTRAGDVAPPCSPQQEVPQTLPTSEEQRRNDLGICKVCYAEEVGKLFVPCGHMACVKCTPNLNNCAMCRAPINATVRAYLS